MGEQSDSSEQAWLVEIFNATAVDYAEDTVRATLASVGEGAGVLFPVRRPSSGDLFPMPRSRQESHDVSSVAASRFRCGHELPEIWVRRWRALFIVGTALPDILDGWRRTPKGAHLPICLRYLRAAAGTREMNPGEVARAKNVFGKCKEKAAPPMLP